MDAHRIKPHIYNINHCRQLDFGHDPARTQSWSGQSRSPIGSRPDRNRISVELQPESGRIVVTIAVVIVAASVATAIAATSVTVAIAAASVTATSSRNSAEL